jgi:hypothetical protein
MEAIRSSEGARYLLSAYYLFLAWITLLTINTEAIRCSETSVDFIELQQRYNPEDHTLHSHRCDKLKSDVSYCVHKISLS